MKSRKHFLQSIAFASIAALNPFELPMKKDSPEFEPNITSYTPKYSLSQWALNRMQFGNSKDVDYQQWKNNLRENADLNLQGSLHPLDFPQKAADLGFNAVEYVNTFFFDKATDKNYLLKLKQNCVSHRVKSLLIMIDEEGFLGDHDQTKRKIAVQAHKKWVDAAAFLGCFAIRVNAHGIGNWDEQIMQSAQSLKELCAYAQKKGLQILIENHGGLSSNPIWLLALIEATAVPNLGVMNDFDNFQWSETQIWGSKQFYNRYLGFDQLMPLTQSVSAKSHHFDMQGYETSIDYVRMAKSIAQHKYNGFISIEYEGSYHSEVEGINLTKALMEKSFVEIQ